MENAVDCGANSRGSFAKYDRDTSLWKTLQLCIDGDLDEYSETWPIAGSMRSGKVYRRNPLVPRTNGGGRSLWATPTIRDAKATTGGSSFDRSLAGEIGGLPNPMFVEWLMGFPAQWARVEGISKPQHWRTQ